MSSKASQFKSYNSNQIERALEKMLEFLEDSQINYSRLLLAAFAKQGLGIPMMLSKHFANNAKMSKLPPYEDLLEKYLSN